MNRTIVDFRYWLIVGCLLLVCGCGETEQQRIAQKLEAVGGVADADERKDGRVVRIVLRGEEITDQQLTDIVGLEKLAHLYLDDSKVTNDGIEQISKMPNIEFLSLRNTGIDDKCVAAISEMKSLKHLYVSETNLTPRGIRKIQKALPDIRIVP